MVNAALWNKERQTGRSQQREDLCCRNTDKSTVDGLVAQ